MRSPKKISERDLTGGRGVTRQEVCHNLQTDLSPEAPPPTDGASAQPMLRPPGDGRLGGYRRDQKDSHSPSSKQVGRKVEQRRGGLRFKRKTCGGTLVPPGSSFSPSTDVSGRG